MNTFKAEDRFDIAGRGVVYSGPAPFDFERDKWRDAFSGEWVIDHPSTVGKVFRVVGLESYCVPTIRKGVPIGLLAVEVAATGSPRR